MGSGEWGVGSGEFHDFSWKHSMRDSVFSLSPFPFRLSPSPSQDRSPTPPCKGRLHELVPGTIGSKIKGFEGDRNF